MYEFEGAVTNIDNNCNRTSSSCCALTCSARLLEVFIQTISEKAAAEASSHDFLTVHPAHVYVPVMISELGNDAGFFFNLILTASLLSKAVIEKDPTLDFLRSLVSTLPDAAPADEKKPRARKPRVKKAAWVLSLADLRHSSRSKQVFGRGRCRQWG